MGRQRKHGLADSAHQSRGRLWGQIHDAAPGPERDERLARAVGATTLGLRTRAVRGASEGTAERFREDADHQVLDMLGEMGLLGTGNKNPADAGPGRYSEDFWKDTFPEGVSSSEPAVSAEAYAGWSLTEAA